VASPVSFRSINRKSDLCEIFWRRRQNSNRRATNLACACLATPPPVLMALPAAEGECDACAFTRKWASSHVPPARQRRRPDPAGFFLALAYLVVIPNRPIRSADLGVTALSSRPNGAIM
jgi:hypothetical protein